jgi:hypothetical protein
MGADITDESERTKDALEIGKIRRGKAAYGGGPGFVAAHSSWAPGV